ALESAVQAHLSNPPVPRGGGPAPLEFRDQIASGSTLSGSSPSVSMAFAATFAVTPPDPARAAIAAAAIDGASTSKNDRSDSRVSLRPKPSVPSAVNGASIHGATIWGMAFIQS